MSDETFVSELFDGDYWLTPDELADWLKLRKDWVYDTVQADRIPYHKFGRQLRFRHSEIQAWLIDRRPANSMIVLSVTWPDGSQAATSMGVRDLLADLMVSVPEEPECAEEPECVEEPLGEDVSVAQAEVDEAGLEV